MQQPIVGPGLCACGCGTPTKLAAFTNAARSLIKGQPTRFVHGHSAHNGPAEFWPRIPSHLGPDVCWPWPGPFDPDGYGSWGGQKVHRILCEQAQGPVPTGLNVLHSCDNPPCCNPAHLRPGTHTTNMRDMVIRDRESRPAAKITPEVASVIRLRYAQGGISQRALAQDAGLGQSQVSRIVNRHHWKKAA